MEEKIKRHILENSNFYIELLKIVVHETQSRKYTMDGKNSMNMSELFSVESCFLTLRNHNDK